MKINTVKYIYPIAFLLAFTVGTASAQQQAPARTQKQASSQKQSASDTQRCATFASFGLQLVVCWDRQNNKNSYSIRMSANTEQSKSLGSTQN